MSFQNQHGSIASELRKIGVSIDTATRIATILGNPNQETRSGPQVQDLTPKSLRYVDSQTRKLQLSNLDFNEGDPDFRRSHVQPGQESLRPTQISSVQSSVAPQSSSASLGVAAGNFTSVKSQGDSVQVGLNVKGKGNLMSMNQGGDQLLGKNLRVDAQSLQESGLSASLENYGNEMAIKMSVDLPQLNQALSQTNQSSTTTTNGGGGDRNFNPIPQPGPGVSQCDTTSDRTTVVTGVSCVNGNLVVTTGTIPVVRCSS